MTEIWIAIAALTAALAGLAILFIIVGRKIMTLLESLQSQLAFHTATVDQVQAAFNTIPDLIRQLVEHEIDKYKAAHPEAEGPVSEADLIAYMQASTEQDKRLAGLAPIIQLWFDQQRLYGDPEQDRPDGAPTLDDPAPGDESA